METPAARQIVPKLAEALRICRETGVRIIYTAHVHRRDGCDMGLFDDLHPPIANRDALVGARQASTSTRSWRRQSVSTLSRSIVTAASLAPTSTSSYASGESTPSSSRTTLENCCQATARDAMFRNYRVVFLSDATGTYDYPDRGFGSMPAADVHHATLVILAASTAHVMSVGDMRTRISSRDMTVAAASR